jgi:methyltransferase, FkbM family
MKTAIYGAGKGARIILNAMKRENHSIDFYIDEFTDETQVDGIGILKIADVTDKENVRVLNSLPGGMASANDPHTSLTRFLKSFGFHSVLEWNEFMWDYPELIEISFEKEREKLLENLPTYKNIDECSVQNLRAILDDKESVHILDQILSRRNGDESPLANLPDQRVQYFPKGVDVFRGIRSLRFADCGAYDGDTTANALYLSPVPVQSIVSFEPDPHVFNKLRSHVATLKDAFPETDFHTYPAGAWSKNDILRFNVNGEEGCSSLITGMSAESVRDVISIPVVSLDSVLSGAPPNFIKMDIEGAEIDALEGARGLIQTCHPTLAVCIYHKPSHLWEIPLMIKKIYPDYQIFLRHHWVYLNETVIYCIAPDGPKIKG